MSVGLTATRLRGGFALRHRFMLVLLWVQVPALALIGLAIGVPIYEVTLTALILAALALGGMISSRHRLAALAVSLGLLATSGVVVYYSGGTEIAHLHFLLMLCAISFYRDSVVLGASVLVVAAYHFVAVLDGSETVSWAMQHTVGVAVFAGLLAIGWRLDKPMTTTDSSGDRFRISFREAPIGMAVLKPSGELIDVNRALASILGYEQEVLLGANVAGLIHPDDHADLGEAWELMGNSRTHSAVEWMRCVTSEGRPIWGRISLSLVPRSEDHAAMVILQLEDTTRAHEEQRRMETLLRGKDEFVAAVSDEIRGPLGLLIDLTDVAEHSHVDSSEALPRIEAHAREIASIVDDLVVSARSGSEPMTVVSVELEVEPLCRDVISSIPGARRIPTDFRASTMWADASLARQIVNNLVSNAVRYGGPDVSLRTINSGPDTVIQITDNGPELPGSERDRVFSGDLSNGSPVTRPAAVGLSLTVSRHLARQMEGDVVYRRTKDGLNVFELRLPAEPISEMPRRRGIMEPGLSA